MSQSYPRLSDAGKVDTDSPGKMGVSGTVTAYRSDLQEPSAIHFASIADWFSRQPIEPNDCASSEYQEVTLDAEASLPATNPSMRSRDADDLAREPQLPDFAQDELCDRMPLSGLQCSAAEYLSHSWRTIPHVTHTVVADVTAMEHHRQVYNESLPATERPLSEVVLIIRGLAIALELHGQFNATFDARSRELLLKQHVNVGLNIESPEGPVMPVIQDAATKDLLELEDEIEWLVAQARAGTLCAEETMKATFTVAYRGLTWAGKRKNSLIHESGFTPIIPWPQVAALGISRIEQQIQLVGGCPQPRMMMPLSLSYDQRVLSGADALRFLEEFCEILAEPLELAPDS